MANFSESWGISKRFEGPWTEYSNPLTLKNDSGNFFPFGKRKEDNYVGTAFGFTANFAYDYVQGWQNLTPQMMRQKMQSLSDLEIETTFAALKWRWCRGYDINNQSIANLLFDFTVMADQAMIKAVASALSKNIKDISEVKKIETRKTTDGYRVLNDKAVVLINTHKSPQKFFNSIKNSYLSYHRSKGSPNSIINRVKSFNYIPNTYSYSLKSWIYY